ncbi:unnamed protein product [Microthlaspi erraticum]|uniref:SWIM-type domain-containing protein n=1 Tax=Microthlaspi erraticum TaxID=1685480 RepID=A0A6D2HVN2_9BRAS|nr:unnamed protein product [Microthlaspi erraticum]
MFFLCGSGDISVGQSYVSKNDLISALRVKAVKSRFAFKVSKSTTKLYVAKCFVDGCKWMCRAAIKNEAKRFFVTKYVKVHTCSVVDRARFRKGCTPRYLGQIFVEQFGIIDGIVPRHIASAIRVLLGLKLNYTTAYRALKAAQLFVRGTPEAGYAALPSYLRRVKQSNPGSVTDLVCEANGQFKYCFLSLYASMVGFQYLRRVIVVDGTHLTGKYGGTLLVAAGQDANFQVFPLAFGIVDAENNESWGWFMNKLQQCFSSHHMVIISDRHPSIPNACLNVLPWVTRGICYYHLQGNIVSKSELGAKDLMYLVKGAAYAHTLREYNRCMASIRAAKPALANYLELADPKLWSRVHFPGDRYNIKTSNIAESINSALKRAKGFPIPYLLQFIREKLGVWFAKRREDALSLQTPYSKGVEYLLAIRTHHAETYTVEHIDGWTFNVIGGGGHYIVNLENRSCECGVFQIEKIPCSHAIAASTEANMHISQNVCMTYTKESLYATYARPIYPEPTEDAEEEEDICLPPEVAPTRGRKKKSRYLTWLELSRKRQPKPRKVHKVYSCSLCRVPGHTRPHCVSH